LRKSINQSIPLVSVVCICYNQADYIEKTIESFLSQQTTFPFEIIIGDDFSTDGTTELINNIYKNNRDKIIPILRRQNIGGHNNLIDCLKSVKGQYIAFCEGDDYWIDECKLQKQFNLLELNTDVGLLWTDIDFNDLHEDRYTKSAFRNKLFPVFNTFEQILLNKPFFAPPTWFFRTKYAKLFYNYQDYVDGTFPFIMDIFQISKILYLDEVTAVYNKRIQSTSNNINPAKRYEFAKQVYKIQIDYSKKYNTSKEFMKTININHYKTLLHYAIIADDVVFLNEANIFLNNYKEFYIKLFLYITRNKFLRFLFRKVFKNDIIFIFFKKIFKSIK
jgi:glucosyltransferase